MTTLKTCSIIIPCHDLENYIGKCLDSIINQETRANYEIICVCDRCTDRTKGIIENILKDTKHKIIDADVGSCGSARNIGLEYATGEYIWFIDGDDWLISSNALETIMNALDDETDIVQFGYDTNGYRYTDGTIIPCNEMVWQYVYRRSIIGDARFRALQPSEDHAFQAAIRAKNPRVKRIENKLYFYNYPRDGSVMWKATHGIKEENIELR